MGQVISLTERLERWEEAYASSQGDVTIAVSTMGRISLEVMGRRTVLEFVEAMTALQAVGKHFEVK